MELLHQAQHRVLEVLVAVVVVVVVLRVRRVAMEYFTFSGRRKI
jgi:hypothetical protein